MLGHPDVSTTLRIYAHIIEGAQEEAASAMDRLSEGPISTGERAISYQAKVKSLNRSAALFTA